MPSEERRSLNLIWSPKECVVDEVMNEAVTDLLLKNYTVFIESFASAESFKLFLSNPPTNIEAVGALFADSYKNRETLPKTVRVSLQSTPLCNARMSPYQKWFTVFKQSVGDLANCLIIQNYRKKKTLDVQDSLYKAIIKEQLKPEANHLPVVITKPLNQKFEEGHGNDDDSFEIVQEMILQFRYLLIYRICMIMFFMFYSSCIQTTIDIVVEKEMHLKVILKTLGFPNHLVWLSWYLKAIIMTAIPSIGCACTFKDTVFSHHAFTVMLVLIFLYVTSFICFSILMSTLFSNSSSANLIGQFLLLIPVYSSFLVGVDSAESKEFFEEGYGYKIMRCLIFHNTLVYAITFMFRRNEVHYKRGISWSDIFDTIKNENEISIGVAMLLLMMDSVIYTLLALYIDQVFPGENGYPQPFYFFLLPSYWKLKSRQKGAEHFETNQTIVIEAPPDDIAIGLSFRNLTKVYGKNVAVENLNLDLYENQITVLLGVNGAGKTTIMEMITGILKPTSGTIVLNGYDIRDNLAEMRNFLGYCPQHNILFRELTVAEHFEFYLKARGILNEYDRNYETEKYLNFLELISKWNARPDTLTGGMQRKLSIALACCGGTKVVLLDEPSSGLDPGARRSLWDLLLEKEGRTIMLSTHFMDEADILGDRIAILASGRLKCVGSPFFLKKTYGEGYTLIIVKEIDCDVQEITKLLQKFVPPCHIMSNVGSELTYNLSQDYSQHFEEMFSELEKSSKELKIASFGVSSISMKEIFIKVVSEKEDQLKTYERTGVYLRGWRLFLQQYAAMMTKMMLVSFRYWKVILLMHIIYILALYYTMDFTVSTIKSYSALLNKMEQLRVHPIINEGSSELQPEMYSIMREYKAMFAGTNTINSKTGKDGSWNTTKKASSAIPLVKDKYMFGVTFYNNKIIALFDDKVPNALLYSLNPIYNAILKSLKGSEYSIEIEETHPIPPPLEPADINDFLNHAFLQILATETVLCIWFLIKDRASESKHLQFVSGVPISTYWISTFAWHMLTTTLTCLLIVTVVASFQMTGWNTRQGIELLLSEIVAFCFTMLSLVYLLSFLFKNAANGLSRVYILFLASGFLSFIYASFALQLRGTYIMCSVENCTAETLANKETEFYLNLIPTHNIQNFILKSINVITIRYMAIENCLKHIGPSEIVKGHSRRTVYATCEEETAELYNHLDEVLRMNIQILLIEGTISFIILILLELYKNRRLDRCACCSHKQVDRDADSEAAKLMDDDVRAEKEKVLALSRSQINEYALVLIDLSKRFWYNNRVVNRLYLTLEKGEAFGLLGVNGAGKSTVFKMMTGRLNIRQGNAYVCGLSLNTEMRKAQKIMGYCPQNNALITNFTPKETISFYGLLRGVPYKEIREFTRSMAQEFNLMDHFKKKVSHLSGGNQRKLSAALAFIGDTKILYLDEPTTGMDQIVKRIIWTNISKARDNGKAVVLTTHSIEECAAVCTKLVIMVNGEFVCLGSQQHLKDKFSKGYTLMIKLSNEMSKDANTTMEVKKFVWDNFPSAIIKSERYNLLTFFIPSDGAHSWSKMFGIMEKSKDTLKFENYSLDQSTLEDVFLVFCSKQKVHKKKRFGIRRI